MPKLIAPEIRAKIKEEVKDGATQTATAKKYNVTFVFVNRLINGRNPDKNRVRAYYSKKDLFSKCPITGW